MTATRMKDAALSVLECLTEEQRSEAQLPFDDPRRELWMYWPREMTGDTYPGVPLHHLTLEQRGLIMQLVATGVDYPTLAQIGAVMALDIPLDAAEQYTRTSLRDPLRYWVTVFGEPADSGIWAWQFEGHHVSINHVIVDGEVVASTPLFLGANPAAIRKGEHIVTRPCGPEEDAGRALLQSLSGERLQRTLLAAPAPIDIVVHRLPEVPDVVVPGDNVHPLGAFQHLMLSLSDSERAALTLRRNEPVGLPRSEMATVQRALMDDLVDLYVGRLPEALAGSELARLEDAGLDGIHFSWAGPPEPGAPHYYRLHGPTFLVEYDCVQDGANHVHAVWRDPARDFGRDPLRAHRAAFH